MSDLRKLAVEYERYANWTMLVVGLHGQAVRKRDSISGPEAFPVSPSVILALLADSEELNRLKIRVEKCQAESRSAKADGKDLEAGRKAWETKAHEIQERVERLLDERTKTNDSFHERCKAVELRLRLMTEAFEAAHDCGDDCLGGCCYDPR